MTARIPLLAEQRESAQHACVDEIIGETARLAEAARNELLQAQCEDHAAYLTLFTRVRVLTALEQHFLRVQRKHFHK